MHDLQTIYTKVYNTLKSVAKDCFVYGENSRYYPNPPTMSDLAVVSLSLTAESTQITSENLLWSKLKKDYPGLFPQLIHRASYKRRRKTLRELTMRCTEKLAEQMVEAQESFMIDSIPIPTCKILRERRSTACHRPEYDSMVANTGRNQILGGWFIGYKVYLITTESGVYRDMLFTQASTHDSTFLKMLSKADTHLHNKELLADRGYVERGTQLRLFEEVGIQLHVPFRRNQPGDRTHDPIKKRKRKMIEVVFSQLCDEFNMRHNYAKRYSGFAARIISKIAARTFKQYWNFIHGAPINRTKHALAA